MKSKNGFFFILLTKKKSIFIICGEKIVFYISLNIFLSLYIVRISPD